jgi:hypothetical protein
MEKRGKDLNRFSWEVQVPELDTSLFILPNDDRFETKNS